MPWACDPTLANCVQVSRTSVSLGLAPFHPVLVPGTTQPGPLSRTETLLSRPGFPSPCCVSKSLPCLTSSTRATFPGDSQSKGLLVTTHLWEVTFADPHQGTSHLLWIFKPSGVSFASASNLTHGVLHTLTPAPGQPRSITHTSNAMPTSQPGPGVPSTGRSSGPGTAACCAGTWGWTSPGRCWRALCFCRRLKTDRKKKQQHNNKLHFKALLRATTGIENIMI